MTTTLRRAREEIADEIGPDVASFSPPDEKHFIAAALMLAMGGAFLVGFFKGLASKLGETSGEHAADALTAFIAKKVGEARKHDPASQDALLESSLAEAQEALRKANLQTAQSQALVADLEQRLADVLAADAPDDVSARIARRVRAVGVELLAANP